jgi:hypothetical protein
MTEAEVRALILSLPGVEEGTSYGYPSYKVAGKFLTRLRSEDASLVLGDVPFEERDMLIEADPDTYHLTPHYEGYPCVLARIAGLDPGTLRGLLLRTWKRKVPKKLLRAWEAEQA